MPELKTIPKEWTVEFHCFRGFVLVDHEIEVTTGGFRMKHTNVEEVWLPFGVDLTIITEIKQRDPDNDCTALYRDGEFLCSVNAPPMELWPHFLNARLQLRKPHGFAKEPRRHA